MLGYGVAIYLEASEFCTLFSSFSCSAMHEWGYKHTNVHARMSIQRYIHWPFCFDRQCYWYVDPENYESLRDSMDRDQDSYLNVILTKKTSLISVNPESHRNYTKNKFCAKLPDIGSKIKLMKETSSVFIHSKNRGSVMI